MEDDSFNPFIEIGEGNKEIKYVTFEDKRVKIQEMISQVAEDLRFREEDMRETLKNWTNNMPEPEVLNIGAKQANLKNQLKWEQMMTSSEKVKKLQRIFRKLRSKK